MSLIAIGIGSAVVGLGSSVVGAVKAGKNKKQADKRAATQNAALENQIDQFNQFEFSNAFEGVGDRLQGASNTQAQAAGPAATQGYTAQQAQLGSLGSAQGYDATQAEAAQLGQAGQVNLRNLASGADFLSNPFENLQVGTAATDQQSREADRAQAQLLESGAITGAGGATALAAQAATSRAGIGADLQRQELQNNQLRAQGQQTLEQGLLAQSNAGNQFGFAQDQFNVGASNDFRSQQAQLTQQANLANAAATNQASQFSAGQANQFALSRFDAQNSLSQFNAGQANQASQFGASAANQAATQAAGFQQAANLQNASSQNDLSRFNAGISNQGVLAEAQGAADLQSQQYGQQQDLLNIRAGQAAGSQGAANQAAANQAGAIAGIGSAAGGVAGAAIGNYQG